MKIALQACVEGSADIQIKPAIRKKDERGNWKIAKGDHCRMLTIPGFRGDRRLVVDESNAEFMGVGSAGEFWLFLKSHPGPGRGEFHYSRVLDNFKFQPAEIMSHEEILTEIEARTGHRPTKDGLPKTYAIMAVRKLRHLAEQEQPYDPPVPVVKDKK